MLFSNILYAKFMSATPIPTGCRISYDDNTDSFSGKSGRWTTHIVQFFLLDIAQRIASQRRYARSAIITIQAQRSVVTRCARLRASRRDATFSP